MLGEEQKNEIDLLKYWYILLKRKWIVIISAIIVLLLGGISTFTSTPVYRATTTLLIEDESSKMLSIEDEFGLTRQFPDITFFNTQLNLLKSRTLAQRVAMELKLLTRPEFGAGKKPRKNLVAIVKDFIFLRWLNFGGKPRSSGQSERELSNPYSGIARDITSRLEIRPIRDTRIVDVSYSTPHPKLAAEVLNTLAREFMRFVVEKRSATTQQASDFLTEAISDISEKIETKNIELQRFGDEKDIPVVRDESEASALKIFEEYESAHAQAMIDLTNARIKYDSIKNLDLESSAITIDDPVIQQLQSDLRKHRSDYNEQRNLLGEKNPKMQKLKSMMEETETQLKEAYQEAVDAAGSEYQRAQETERGLRRLRDQEAAKIVSSGSLLRRLQIELDNLTNQLNVYTQMKDEAEISSQLAGFSTSNISVVDPAEIPRRPISPNRRRSLLMSLFLGLFLGVGLCVLLEFLDNTIKSPDDIERLTGIPSLGVVPYLPPEGVTSQKKRYFSRSRDFYSYGEDVPEAEEELERIKNIELINLHHPKFFISEDYRTIRTSILLSNADSPPKSLLFTSALPMEGKSTTCSNVAVAFSQLAERVLIIDADLRKPRLHRLFGVKNIGGLSSFLIGKIPIKEAIKMSSIQNIWLLPSGPIPPNPAEIVTSHKMKDTIEALKHEFDIIILDSPPMMPAIDTVILSSIVDAVILVVRANRTTNKAFLHANEELQKARAKVIGVVLNELKLNPGNYYYKDYYHGGAYNHDE